MGMHTGDVRAELGVGKASRRLGLSEDLLRGLATSHGFPITTRTAGGHRRYPVVHLDLINAAVQRGYALPEAFAWAKRVWQTRTDDLVKALQTADFARADAITSERLGLRPGDLRIGIASELYAAAGAIEDEAPNAAKTALVHAWAARWIDRIADAMPSPRPAPGVLLVDATDGDGTHANVALRLLALLVAADRTAWMPFTLPLTHLAGAHAAAAAVGARGVSAVVLVGERADTHVLHRAGVVAPIVTLACHAIANTHAMPSEPTAWTAAIRQVSRRDGFPLATTKGPVTRALRKVS